MVLMISAKQNSIESQVEPRFGRSPWLILFDTSSKKWEAFENPGIKESGGAGIAAAQFVINKGANTVISGAFGPNASQAFHAGNIQMFLFADDSLVVSRAIELFEQGKLSQFN